MLRTISMLIPHGKDVATGDYPVVGGAQGELEITDSRTGQVLAAAVDLQIGGGALKTAAQWKWGDVENVMDEWAKLIATRLAALRAAKSTN